MNIMEQMMGLMMGRMTKEDKEAMMDSMMEKFFADITPEEKQKMLTDMMPKMMEGMNMSDMMPKMMMTMMAGKDGEGSGMMGKMMGGGSSQGMPEMMMKTMMPNCIAMMLPKIDVAKREQIATPILSALVKSGVQGMSNEQEVAYRQTLEKALTSGMQNASVNHGETKP